MRVAFPPLAGLCSRETKGLERMDENAKSIARPAASRSLREAIRKARLEEAEKLDLAADHRDGEIARLELLKAELEAVFAEMPNHDDRFNLVLVPSRPARLWIDLFTYAAIDDASGAYLFLRNSESGRRTLFSSNNVADVADRITRYMAHEIVHRERLEASLTGLNRMTRLGSEPFIAGASMGVVIAAFAIGLLTGVAGLLAAVWLTAP
jgi:hypothetical protein